MTCRTDAGRGRQSSERAGRKPKKPLRRPGSSGMRVDGSECEIPFDAVARAHTIYHFTRADFAKDAGSR